MPNRPTHSIEIWPVRSVIWLNGQGDKKQPSFTIERRYRDRSGDWQSSSSFFIDDLASVSKLADMSLEWWLTHGAEYLPRIESHERTEDH